MTTRETGGSRFDPWAVILAGGDGERTRPFIERWLGYHKPKQYCTFAGNQSLFQQTVDRAGALTSVERKIAVVASDHADEARMQLRDHPAGILVVQPSNRGTAPGVLLALARVHAEDPGAVAVIYPSDHFVRPEEEFVMTVARAVAATSAHPGRLVLVGAMPDGPEPDYGWVLPGSRLDFDEEDLYDVGTFVEKPPSEISKDILARGGLWNTMVLVGKVGKFWQLAWQHVPEVMPLFARYRDAVGTSREATVLESIYQRMPKRDFSKDVLQKAPEALAVLPLRGVLWSDWGRPERIAETLRSIGTEPAFSEELLLAADPS